MKICMVTNMYPTGDNPAYGIFIKSQIDSIASLGHNIDLLFIDGRRSRLRYIAAVWRLRRMVKKGNYDLIHAHYGLSGMVACTQRRCPVVVSFCGDDLLGTPTPEGGITFKSKVIIWLGQLAAFLARGIIVKSQQMRACLQFHRARLKAVVIPNGVDFGLFHPMDRDIARRDLGLRADIRYILFPSTPSEPRKRLDLAEKAVALVRSEFPGVELIVLHQAPQKKVPVYMNACDALIMTSDWEGSPNVVKEAMACNLPVIAVNAGDAWEVIDRAKNCYRAERNPRDLSDKLKSVLASRKRSDGRSRMAHLELGAVARRVDEVYRSVLGAK